MSRLDDPVVIETDWSLWKYTRNLRVHGETKIVQLDEFGPVEVWRVHGYTGHIIVVDKEPFHDTDEEMGAALARLEPDWRCFAIAFNPEDEWEVRHYEPVRDARPLC